MTVNKERVELLCQALESGETEQCFHALRRPVPVGRKFGEQWKWSYCALGLAIKVAVDHGLMDVDLGTWGQYGVWPEYVSDWYGINDSDPEIELDTQYGPFITSISGANDDGASFWDIAQALRTKYLKEEG